MNVIEGKHHPAVKHKIHLGQSEAVASNGVVRKVLKGMLEINYTETDFFGKQVQFLIFTKDNFFETEEANPSDYRRAEVYMPVDKVEELIEYLTKIKEEQNGISNRAD